MDEMNTVNTEQQPTTQPADNGTQGNERMFSQAEVDEIIRRRLARVKTSSGEPVEPTEVELRERDLAARENRLSCKEYLIENSYPHELLDILDTSDPEDFNKRADKVFSLMDAHASRNPRFVEPIRSTEPGSLTGSAGFLEFKKTKHTPRPYPY